MRLPSFLVAAALAAALLGCGGGGGDSTTEPPPPRTYRADLDPALEAIVLKCLKKEAAGRYPSAGALADDLGRWLRHEPT